MLSDEQKERFLELVADGYDRQCAAQQVDATGSQFKRAMNRESRTYDQDLASRYEFIVNGRPEGFQPKRCSEPNEPRRETALGFTKAAYITDEERETFLEKVRNGIPRELAAREIGTSLKQMQTLARTNPEFGAELTEAYAEGYENYVEWLRAKAVEQVREGNYTALRDALMVHAPEYEKLRTSRHEVGGPGGTQFKILVEQVLPNLPKHVLDQVIEAVESGEQLALPPAGDQAA